VILSPPREAMKALASYSRPLSEWKMSGRGYLLIGKIGLHRVVDALQVQLVAHESSKDPATEFSLGFFNLSRAHPLSTALRRSGISAPEYSLSAGEHSLHYAFCDRPREAAYHGRTSIARFRAVANLFGWPGRQWVNRPRRVAKVANDGLVHLCHGF
jgi:hypothetical protein